MTVNELIAELQKLPGDVEVMFEGDAGYCSVGAVLYDPVGGLGVYLTEWSPSPRDRRGGASRP